MGRRVVCAGTFDHFHPGHLNFLWQAKALGEELLVIVARDETVRRIKGFTPTHDEEQRRAAVAKAGIADLVVLGHLDADLFEIVGELAPDIVALGYDQRVTEEELLLRFPRLQVVRLVSFHPEHYKSSAYRHAGG